jgi:hypothetical protein
MCWTQLSSVPYVAYEVCADCAALQLGGVCCVLQALADAFSSRKQQGRVQRQSSGYGGSRSSPDKAHAAATHQQQGLARGQSRSGGPSTGNSDGAATEQQQGLAQGQKSRSSGSQPTSAEGAQQQTQQQRLRKRKAEVGVCGVQLYGSVCYT